MIKREYGESPTLETRKESEESVNKKIRYNQIVEILFGGKEMTAKEIAVEMHQRGYIPTTERNYTAPRLTELSQKGIVEPIGKTKCKYSNKMVVVYKLIKNI
jgi:hypothetical protein